MSLAYHDGRLLPLADIRISPNDAGFLLGDGLFETLRVEDGRAWDVPGHLDRLFAGLERIGVQLPETRCEIAAALTAVAADAPRPTARLRLTVSRGEGEQPTRLITARAYDPPDAESYRQGVAVQLLHRPALLSTSPTAGLKSLSYQAHVLALHEARAAGAWDTVLLNEHGHAVEGARANLIVVLHDGKFTPPLSDGCLPGIVRRRLLEAGSVKERSLDREDLDRAIEVLLTNSLIGVLPVSRLDGRPVGVHGTADRLRGLLPGFRP
ncbi:MAG TPA: aminotransferase class IV [Thermoanaerobaculia bacterium]|jgi:branched-chain amino acid aminotransferase|nr:aminotransferase class IV [Thermoanaerobaculia bacterium]